ncbi:MAG: class I SAM-dependent methyltransferase [Mojavia pulchra JT2-VF2]|jgi:2-polyprenyl-3-methyl-5-hydroxy-6-metoxy-1,4-benzoquinol methylase|uniref:Class I SAM-dependent methyltransferase n=1 Tax=Mojavia pulchra JT2-VF2 TaxID=287848 RepID=A0A951UI20_9NOST|nr:class I SAM-dependent methyltransferase [Mojavia pulchra JT2-VF2]
MNNSVTSSVEALDNLSITWERLIPNRMGNDSASRKILELHIGRYEAASRYVLGKKVLDIASGTGYGSQMLRFAGASSVVGVDISLETVEYAKKHYQAPEIEFICANAEQFECLEPFDVVVSFETIEHLKNPTNFLKQIRKFLAPNGVFIISVPLGETRHFDPYHLHAFTQDEILNLLEKTGFYVDNYRCDQCFLTRSELLYWRKLYPESSPSFWELLFTRRGWHIMHDLFIQGGFDVPQLLVTAYKIRE